MKLTPEERETIIRFDDAGKTATIYTCNQTWKTKLAKLADKSEEIKLIAEDEYSQTYAFPKKRVHISSPQKMSEETARRRIENLKAYRNKKTSK